MIDIPQELRENHSQVACEILGIRHDPYAQKYIRRSLERIEVQENGCWTWKGKLSSNGYALIWIQQQYVRVHRWMYILFKGAIADGLQIDHLCRNRTCVNPDHLDAVTQHENILRGVSFSAVNAKKTHCPKGHEYSEENTYYDNRNYRSCKECNKTP